MRHKILAASIVAALLGAGPEAARAVIYRDDTGSGNPGAPTANGTGTASTDYVTLLNSDPAYQAVGTLSAVGFIGVGGGVLIRTPGSPATSQYILTVAHLFGSDTPSQITWTPNGSSDTYTGTAIVTASNTDLAIVKLDRPVTEVAPATIYTGSSEVGQVGTIVGVGYGGNGTTGPNGPLDPQGIVRAGQNMIDLKGFTTSNGITTTFNPDPAGPYLFTDFDKQGDPSFSTFGSPIPLTLEAGTTFGDSGGGLFATIGGQTFLVGAIDDIFFPTDSMGVPLNPADPGAYGDIDGFIDTSAAQALIEANTPEPGTLSLLVAGCAGLLLGRRRAPSSRRE